MKTKLNDGTYIVVDVKNKFFDSFNPVTSEQFRRDMLNDRIKVFTSYNKIQQEIKKLLTELNGDYKVISLICRTEILYKIRRK